MCSLSFPLNFIFFFYVYEQSACWYARVHRMLPRCMQNLEDGIAYSGTEVQVAVSLCVGPGHQTQILWKDIKGF